MKSFGLRILSGSVYVLSIIGSLWLNNPLFFGSVVVLFTFLCLSEYFMLVRKIAIRPQIISVFIIAVAWCIDALFTPNHSIFLFVALLGVFSIFVVELFRKQPEPIHSIAYSILPLLYIVLPFSLLILTGYHVHGKLLLVSYFTMLWANDTFAYLVGITLGKHKFFPSISPKKTWEGLIGGILSVMVVAIIFAYYEPQISIIHWLGLALVISGTAIFGDLVESMFKRKIGVKDSGKCMPGHGGILDRTDALLISFPFVFAYIKLFI